MSWPSVKLDDIFKIARGGSPRPIKKYITTNSDGVNWISIKDASNSDKYITKTKLKISRDGISKSREVKPGDFLLTNSMSFGRPYIMKTSGCIHDGWLVLSGDSRKIDTEYFYHLLGSEMMYRKFSGLAAGAVVKNLNIDLVKSVEIPLPPLEEQKRIAVILDKADAVRRKRQQAIDLTDQLLRSVFLDMFGDPVTNPKGWAKEKFGTVTQSRLGKMLDAKQQTGLHQHFYLRNPNVRWGKIVLDELKKMDFDKKDQIEFQLKNGDVLICEGGAVGRSAIWRGELENCYFQKALHRVRPIEGIVNSEYVCDLMWFMDKHGGFKDYVSSATIAHLTGAKLKDIEIPIPPIEIQKEYTQYVKKYRSSSISLQKSKESIEKLFSSITKNAFRGELYKQTKAA